jgi:hypothetical protein
MLRRILDSIGIPKPFTFKKKIVGKFWKEMWTEVDRSKYLKKIFFGNLNNHS